MVNVNIIAVFIVIGVIDDGNKISRDHFNEGSQYQNVRKFGSANTMLNVECNCGNYFKTKERGNNGILMELLQQILFDGFSPKFLTMQNADFIFMSFVQYCVVLRF